MKKEVAMKWVAALRSGKFKQGHGVLHSGDKFCCLGVLCDISGQGEWVVDSVGANGYSVAGEGMCKGVLHDQVQKWSGVINWDGKYLDKKTGKHFKLSQWNDLGYSKDTSVAKPQTFEQIANWIEKNWKAL